jgi:hypothetical protein
MHFNIILVPVSSSTNDPSGLGTEIMYTVLMFPAVLHCEINTLAGKGLEIRTGTSVPKISRRLN